MTFREKGSSLHVMNAVPKWRLTGIVFALGLVTNLISYMSWIGGSFEFS